MKIAAAIVATVLLASAGVASAQDQSQRHQKQHPRYYNMVPNDPVSTPTVPDNNWNVGDYNSYPGGTGVSGQAKGL